MNIKKLLKSTEWILYNASFESCDFTTEDKTIIELIKNNSNEVEKTIDRIFGKYVVGISVINYGIPYNSDYYGIFTFCNNEIEKYYSRPEETPGVKLLLSKGFKVVIAKELYKEINDEIERWKESIKKYESFLKSPNLPVKKEYIKKD